MYRNAFFHYLVSASLSVYMTSLPLSCCCQRNYYEFGMKNFCHECKVLKLIRLLICMYDSNIFHLYYTFKNKSAFT